MSDVSPASSRSSTSSSYLAQVLVFCLCWSAAFPLAKLGLRDAPPLKFLCLRFLLASVLMLAWGALRAWRRGTPFFPRDPDAAGQASRWRPWVLLAVIGLCNNALYLGLCWSGMLHLSSGLSSVIISTNPVWVALAASLLLGERLDWRRGAGLLLCMAGVCWIVWQRLGLRDDTTLGVVLVSAGALSLVAGTMLFKRWQQRLAHVDLLLNNAVQVGVSGLLLIPLALWLEAGQAIHWTPSFVWSFTLMVGLVSIAAYLLWLHLLRTRSATEASALHFLMPPLGLLMSWLSLGEPLQGSDLLGILPVAGGLWLVTRREPRAARAAAIA
ncbi:multidrug DMT transporter permease [Hylemonella gracilis str. Niagara R]|uniref:Multidrug DMT transporter permease n=1 Tax=Hylemonella gracilis str. Niagara R TaxID=1458275 RepID=A0A016XHN7_9BURK|nr:DMT family transporter [Hylemonella gracilis]EYC51589.1 multidrug DMT transporter permease [Hylemonella gracilis str. Niagara R]